MIVVPGGLIWFAHETMGIPLELSLSFLADRKMSPTWDGLVNAAFKSGVNRTKFFFRLRQAVVDAYPYEPANIIIRGLNKMEEQCSGLA